VVTYQLQVERRTAKAHRPKTDALPLDHVTNVVIDYVQRWIQDFRRGFVLGRVWQVWTV